MQWLLVAVGVLVVGGLLALVTSRSERLSTFWGSASGVLGCALGAAGVIAALLDRQPQALQYAWSVPFGSFSVELDPLSSLFALVVFGLSGLAALYAARYVEEYWRQRSVGGLFFFFNLLVASMVLVVVARNVVLFLMAWEVMALAAYFLITFEDEHAEVREAGKTFLIASHLGTAFLLPMFLWGFSGASLEFADFAIGPGVSPSLLFLLALVGFGTKAGIMPLHVWLPEAHPVAPSFVSAVLSGAMTKIGIYGLLRSLILIGHAQAWWGWMLVGLGAVSGILGILSALGQGDIKKLLAYSTVENIGIISMAIGLGTIGLSTDSPLLVILGFSAALFHVVNHAMFKGLLFLGAGAVAHATGTRELDRLGGLMKRMPGTATAMLVGAVAIAGLPPLNGFASEFLLYSAAFGPSGLLSKPPTAIAALIVIASLALIGGLAAYTFVKACGIALLGEPRTKQAAAAHAPPVLMSLPIVLLAAGCVAASLLAPTIVGHLTPIVSQISRVELDVTTASAAEVLVPLSYVAFSAALLMFLAAVLALVRRVLLADREVTASGTWGCGYSAGTPRIQYTASSFARPGIEFFGPLFRSRRKLAPPVGLFPPTASLATESSDLSSDLIYRPLFGSVNWALSKLRWLQHGRVHLYVLYLGCTILALMIWYVFKLAPADARSGVAAVEVRELEH